MPKDLQKILDNISNEMKENASDLDVFDSHYDFMDGIFNEIKANLSQCLLFGPCNSAFADKHRVYADDKSHRFFGLSSCQLKAIAALRSNWIMHYSSDPDVGCNPTELHKIALRGFISATGVCESYAVLGAFYLTQRYDIVVSIENIHSDQSHTYIVVHTQPTAFIFDFWSGNILPYGDWVSWNEAADYDFRYSSSATTSLLAEKLTQNDFDAIQKTMESTEAIEQREKHIQKVLDSLPISTAEKIHLHQDKTNLDQAPPLFVNG